MNEWEFTAEVASWVNEIIVQNPAIPFHRAKCEQHKKGSQKRRDITLFDKDQRIVLTGEVKLPFHKDGSSPYNTVVVDDARKKALQAGTAFFFTWNVNEFVLWESLLPKTSWLEQNFRSWEVTNVHHEDQLDLPMTVHAIKAWIALFLKELAQILRGTSKIGYKSPDEKFIEMLESHLRMPILLNIAEMDSLYNNQKFKSEINKWLRDEQGWIIYSDPEGIRDNLERATKFSCYTLVNKLVFYEALLKRYGDNLEKINLPNHIDTGETLRLHLEGYFAEAKKVTKDYETVFGEEHTSIGNRIPFYSDSSVTHWGDLLNQIHAFDFSKLDYEVIGNIFERLISPEERHKYGQFYTKPEVVDLINSFCIQRGDETIMDPACGGGTFLVRAYARKRELCPSRKHRDLLSDLYGTDISHFAAHLTTINLATRNLIDDENYPQIARSNFFDVRAHKTFLKLPRHMETKGLGKIQHRDVELSSLDAVVGNPPYVRHQDIPKEIKQRGGFKAETKEFLQKLIKEEAGVHLSGRSDIHCYFWPHAATFLKDDGYLCFLTSSQWLDVEYGFDLQGWILNNFEIIAILESLDEPWFIGARVATAITILKRQKDNSKRMSNLVRFVQLRRPICEILSYDGTTVGAIMAADRFRDEILSIGTNTANDKYRIRVVSQKDLWGENSQLAQVSYKSDESTDYDLHGHIGDYQGGKWGVYLRAPDLWFRLLDSCSKSFVPLGEIAEISSGILSGKDSFFLVVDCSNDLLDKVKDSDEFKDAYEVPREKVESGEIRLVLCGEGRNQVRPIEAKYLEFEIHSLDEVKSFTVNAS